MLVFSFRLYICRNIEKGESIGSWIAVPRDALFFTLFSLLQNLLYPHYQILNVHDILLPFL